MKKLASVLLAATMAMSVAACNNDGSKPSESESGKSEAPSTTQSADAQSSESETAESTAPNGEVVNLKWVAVGSGMPKNYDTWKENIDPYLAEKIGVNIDMEIVGWGDWDARRATMVSTGGDDYDIMFTNGGTYMNDVKTGVFMDITDMVNTSMSDLVPYIPADYWEACKINGKLYGVPTYKDSSQTEYIVWDMDMAEKAGIDPSTIDSFEKMTPALKAIKETTGEASFVQKKEGASYITYLYDGMGAGLPGLGVRYDDPEGKVVFAYEQDDVMSNLKTLHQWFLDGIINSDAAVKADDEGYKPVIIAQGWSGAAKTTWGRNIGTENAEAFQWGPTVMSNETVRGSMNCINTNSKNPEKALEFLQLVNLDSHVRDAFYYGVEGDNFEYTGEGDARRVHKNNTDWTMAGYTQGTFFTVTQQDAIDFNEWDEVKELNEKATPSVLLGFTLDVEPFRDQLTNCAEIYTRYQAELLTGTSDPEEAVPQMKAEMEKAGLNDVIEGAQKQVDEFLKK